MRLYPAIDLKDGKCVRLMQGDYDKVTKYHDDPVEVARRWESMGATYLHVVDLDGAKCGEGINDETIRAIANSIDIPVQVGGGIRTIEDIQNKLDSGVTRVILGSRALEDPDFVKEAIQAFGASKIVVGIDAKNGLVATHGWLNVSNVEAITFVKKLKEIGVKTIIYTDISKDGMMSGPNLDETKKMVEESGIAIIASGGVSNMSDLAEVSKIGARGAIIGKALYLNKINLEEVCNLYERGEEDAQ